MQKRNIYSRLTELSNKFNCENIEKTKQINKTKFDTLRQWSLDNGALFNHSIEFPIAYGPFGYYGVKAKIDINSNEAIIFVPRKQMIISKDYEDKFPFIKVTEEKDDRSNLILTLILITEEEKGNNSFYKPYLDVLPINDFLIFWDQKSLNELDDDRIIESVKSLCYEMKEEYNEVVKNERFKNLSLDKFIFFYSHVNSREFYINDTTSALVPLAELFNHDVVKTRYEFYDSENMVFKFTKNLCGNTIEDIQGTKSSVLPVREITYDPYKEIVLQKDDHKKDDEEDNDGAKNVDLGENDFFVFATSSEQQFKKGNQLFLNYSKLDNRTSLVHYGFNSIDNYFDSTVLYMEFDIKNKETLKGVFPKHLKCNKPGIIELKLKIKFRKICESLIKYFRFEHFKTKSDYYICSFDQKLEHEVISKSIEFLNKHLKILNEKHSIEDDLTFLEGDKMTLREMNFVIYRLRRKINLAHQIDLLNKIKSIMENHQLKDYLSIVEFLEEMKDVSHYDIDKNCLNKMVKFVVSQQICLSEHNFKNNLCK